MPNNKNRRALLGALTLATSSAALCLSATDVEAAEWHTNWGTTPAIAPRTGAGIATAPCEYSMPAGESVPPAVVNVQISHTWLTLTDWRANLGYSPEAMSYHLCTGYQGTSTWVASAFFPLWRYMQLDRHALPPAGYNVDSGLVPPSVLRPEDAPGEYFCPGDHPFVVGAFCQTRAWW